MADSSSSSTVHTNVPDVGSTRTDHVSVQVTTTQLNKENYLRWSAAITMGIAERGRIAYVNGRKVEPVEGSMAWDTWFLEDNQVKTWIINSVFSDIQPLILRKKTARDMWIILEHMVFLFLFGLNDDFENMSQILNSDESFSIEDVYARVEAEEQRKLVSGVNPLAASLLHCDESSTPNPISPSLDDPSRAQKQPVEEEIQTVAASEELPIALRKGVRSCEVPTLISLTTTTATTAAAAAAAGVTLCTVAIAATLAASLLRC
ncbi:hypothetical protein EJ110_NYTH44775 [Nymphaea thermarum]|nr:hypothetical protein EJ110_NYTH44775 [Nymphaea thermarum]